jgi:hypothetical protein
MQIASNTSLLSTLSQLTGVGQSPVQSTPPVSKVTSGGQQALTAANDTTQAPPKPAQTRSQRGSLFNVVV